MPDGNIELHARTTPTPVEYIDAIIVGAGLSGIGVACRMARQCRRTTFAVLESRDRIGGTWDLFRYPGIRSDSDMNTMSYGFRPWRQLVSFAPAGDILDYIRQTAAASGIEPHIRLGHRVRHAAWSTENARWTLDVDTRTGSLRLSCGVLLMCSGYYDYEQAHAPVFPDVNRFVGRIVHPQFWPEGLDYAGKRVIVVGSGATAVTLVPAMARDAAHVVMLQRSPSYIVSRPSEDAITRTLHRLLPRSLAARLTRAKNIAESLFYYRLARARPDETRRRLIGLIRRELGDAFEARHFTPAYRPWDQRVCLVPDADLFDALRTGRASIETGPIECFTQTGIRLASGREIAADIVVTATGLKVTMMGGARVTVDGQTVEFDRRMTYKGMMISDVPNMIFVIGYTNASWTLKSDLVASYACRLINVMRRRSYTVAVARRDPGVGETALLDFTSGYVQRAASILPKQGDRAPWRLYQNYLRDMPSLRYAPLRDGTLHLSRR